MSEPKVPMSARVDPEFLSDVDVVAKMENLTPFDQAAAAERVRALALHPPEEWAGMTSEGMLDVLEDEVYELYRAVRDNNIHGEHGIFAEAVQVAGVARRIYEEITKREAAKDNGEGK